MADSIPPSNKRFPRVRRQWERAKPWWHRVVAVARTFDDAKKVGSLLFYVFLVGGAGAAWWKVTTPSDKPAAEITAPKPPEPPKTEPPKSVAPVVPVDKPCNSISLSKIRDALTDTDTAPTAYKSFGGRQHCGWHLTVAAEPAVHTNGMWRVRFQARDGVRVIAEMRIAPALREGDVVLVGGTIGGYLAGDAPAILLKGAWVQRR